MDIKTYEAISKSDKYCLRCTECKNKLMYPRDYDTEDNTFRCRICNAVMDEPKASQVMNKTKVFKDGNMKSMVVKRNLSDDQFFHRHKILQVLNKAYKDGYVTDKVLRDCALVSVLFLTGSRISEIVGMRDYTNKGKYLLDPLKKSQILINKDKPVPEVIFENLPVLKKKRGAKRKLTGESVQGVDFRNVKIPYEPEKEFMFFIEKWCNVVHGDDAFLFPISRQRAWQVIFKYMDKTFCHFFRHCRASDLSKHWGFSPHAMQKFFKWSNTNMTDRYTHVGEEELFNLMTAKKVN